MRASLTDIYSVEGGGGHAPSGFLHWVDALMVSGSVLLKFLVVYRSSIILSASLHPPPLRASRQPSSPACLVTILS